MALPKPTTNMDWTDGAASKVVEPSAGKKLIGWTALERPPFEFMNFLFFNTDEWVKYLESVTDDLLAGNVAFDIIVGSGPGTVADINAAVAAASPGDRIFVNTAQALTVLQTISKDDLEFFFAPDAIVTQATTLVKGILVTSARVKIKGLRLGSWNNDSGGVWFNGNISTYKY